MRSRSLRSAKPRATARAANWAAHVIAALAAIAFFLVVGAAPGRAETPAGCPPPAGPHTLDPTDPINLGQLKLQLRDYRCFKYDDEVAAVLAEALSWVVKRAPQVVNPAVVLDIDETSLSNWARIWHNDFGYIPGGACELNSPDACGAIDWDYSLAATAIAPTLDLFNAAKAKHVAVFFISGRYNKGLEQAATELTLTKAKYFGWDGLYLRDPGNPRASLAEFKRDMRIQIESNGYTIIANVGDQWSDLVLEHAEKIFKVPNPFYFIP